MEVTAVKLRFLRGLLAVPGGLLFAVLWSGAYVWPAVRQPPVLLPCLGFAGVAALRLHRYYDDRYGRVRFQLPRRAAFTVASLGLFAASLIVGSAVDYYVGLSASATAILFGLAMLAWFKFFVVFRLHHLVVWGGLVAVGLLPVWDAIGERTVPPAGVAAIAVALVVGGVLDHVALVRDFGTTDEARASA